MTEHQGGPAAVPTSVERRVQENDAFALVAELVRRVAEAPGMDRAGEAAVELLPVLLGDAAWELAIGSEDLGGNRRESPSASEARWVFGSGRIRPDTSNLARLPLAVGSRTVGQLSIELPPESGLPDRFAPLVEGLSALSIGLDLARTRETLLEESQRLSNELRRANRILSRRVQEMETVNRVLRTLDTLDDFGQSLCHMAQDLVLLRGIDLCDISLLDENGSLIVQATAAGGAVRGYVERGDHLDRLMPHYEAVAIRDLVLFRDQIVENDPTHALLSSFNIGSHLALPLVVNGEVGGVLSVATAADKPSIPDEYIVLTSAMAAQLNASITQLRLIEDLKAARVVAEASNEAKSRFLANMSHELRTPLNGVLGMASLLLDSELSEEQLLFADTIRTSGQSLLAVISGILDFAKIEGGHLELERYPFVLRDCVEDALDLVAVTAGEKGVDLVYEIDPLVPTGFVGDIVRLRQILLNLLSNAAKFTAQGHIAVQVGGHYVDDERFMVKIDVQDTGIGIAPDRIERLFRPFAQADTSTTRRFGGTGLGLVISKELANLMGGDLTATSTAGRGSTFTCTVLLTISNDTRADREFTGVQEALEGLRVLLVDDNEVNLAIISRQVKSWGMLAEQAKGADEAIELVGDRHDLFDLAVLDFQMPDRNGLSLARELRRQGFDHPIILASSIGSTSPEGEGSVFDWQLSKPVKPELLCRVLHRSVAPERLSSPSAKNVDKAERDLAERMPMEILVAEDNKINRQVALLMLRRMGYEPVVVSNGQDAVDEVLARAAAENEDDGGPFDLVLMDVDMPILDGPGATSRIIDALDEADRPWIVAMTANVVVGDRESYLEAGMDDYLSKPIQLGSLTETLKRVPRPDVKPTGEVEKPRSPEAEEL